MICTVCVGMSLTKKLEKFWKCVWPWELIWTCRQRRHYSLPTSVHLWPTWKGASVKKYSLQPEQLWKEQAVSSAILPMWVIYCNLKDCWWDNQLAWTIKCVIWIGFDYPHSVYYIDQVLGKWGIIKLIWNIEMPVWNLLSFSEKHFWFPSCCSGKRTECPAELKRY